MQNANIQEAKTHLSQLIESVLAGEDVIISQGGFRGLEPICSNHFRI